MNATEPVLPAEFADLEPLADWAQPTETARNHKRIAETQPAIDAFAAAMIPRLDAICAYLDAFPLDDMPADARALYYMMLSVAEVSPSVEGYHAPAVPYGYDSRLFRAQETFPLRPRF
jgi:hypothetical protein